jgi:hypothetical protein
MRSSTRPSPLVSRETSGVCVALSGARDRVRPDGPARRGRQAQRSEGRCTWTLRATAAGRGARALVLRRQAQVGRRPGKALQRCAGPFSPQSSGNTCRGMPPGVARRAGAPGHMLGRVQWPARHGAGLRLRARSEHGLECAMGWPRPASVAVRCGPFHAPAIPPPGMPPRSIPCLASADRPAARTGQPESAGSPPARFGR